jgi:hypothetical protein
MEYTATFTAAGQVTPGIFRKKDEPYQVEIGVGFTGVIAWEYSPDSGANEGWQVVGYSAITTLQALVAAKTGYYRLMSYQAAGSSNVVIKTLPVTLKTIENENGDELWRVDDDGVALKAKSVIGAAGAPTPQTSRSFGAAIDEGLGLLLLDEIVDLTDAGALFVDLTSELPDAAQVWAINAQITEAVTAGGTSTKVGIGPSGDPDKYGKTADLALDSQCNSGVLVGGTPLGAAEQVRVNAVTDAGAAGDTNFSAGKVRVRVIYALIRNLTEIFADV